MIYFIILSTLSVTYIFAGLHKFFNKTNRQTYIKNQWYQTLETERLFFWINDFLPA